MFVGCSAAALPVSFGTSSSYSSTKQEKRHGLRSTFEDRPEKTTFLWCICPQKSALLISSPRPVVSTRCVSMRWSWVRIFTTFVISWGWWFGRTTDAAWSMWYAIKLVMGNNQESNWDFEWFRVKSKKQDQVYSSTFHCYVVVCVCALKLLFVQIPVTKNPVAICCHCSHRTCHRAICGPCPFGLMVGLLLKRWSSLNCSRVALVCYRLMGKCVFKQIERNLNRQIARLQQMLTWFSRKDGQDLTYSIYISKSYCKSSPPLHASQCVPRMGGASHRCHQGCVEGWSTPAMPEPPQETRG